MNKLKEKILRKKIEKRKKLIQKYQEEVNKMGLVLKDGKLQQEENVVQQQPQQPMQMPPPSADPFQDLEREVRQHRQQHMQQPPQQQYPVEVTVTLYMVDQHTFSVPVDGNQIDLFVSQLDSAIDNQSTFHIGQRVINGRHVIHYTFQ